MTAPEQHVTEWTLDGVLDELTRIDRSMKDRQFVFVLGAGASFTSGIPTGSDLAQKWLKDLHLRECADGSRLETWLESCGIGSGNLSLATSAEYYSQIFERRFAGDRESGYAELETAMEGKAPSLGYSLLAEVIQNTRHKVVITTNFDNLVADALAMHAHQSPLVVGHESLAGFVRPQLRRPLVAKIHRDLFLQPINDVAGVATMEKSWRTALKKLFQYFTPIVVGYGGNDGSLMDMLVDLAEGDVAGRMIWCYRDGAPPPIKAIAVLKKHNGIKVKIAGFDEFMAQLADKLVENFDVADIADRTEKLGKERADQYREQAKNLTESSARGTPAEQKAGSVISQSVRSRKSWWAWYMMARAERDIDQSERIYLEGLEQFPRSVELTGNYANFLADQRKDLDAAEAMHKKALEIDPSNANANGNYAIFLTNKRKNLDSAEVFYKKALELNPSDANNTRNYAIFLGSQRKDFEIAEVLFKKALELEPSNTSVLGSYAYFLAVQRKDLDGAEAMHKKAIELDPSNGSIVGNYALFLADERKDLHAAEAMHKKAIELDPGNAHNIRNFAIFLADRLKDFDAAEAMFKKALDLDPSNASIISGYAFFLANRRNNNLAAEEMYKKALEVDPRNANINCSYAIFLVEHSKDFDAADDAYKKALELDPQNGNITTSYANFLGDKRKDFGMAEVMYKRAVELEPSNVNVIGSYAIFLTNQRKDLDAAEAMHKQALELDPNNANVVANYACALLTTGAKETGQHVLKLVHQVLNLSQPDVNQTVAEALLYGALVQIQAEDSSHYEMLARLKNALEIGFKRGSWDFSAMFAEVLPKLPNNFRDFFQLLGEAILNSNRLPELKKFDHWVMLPPIDVFSPASAR